MTDHVIVAGGGPVGCAFACACEGQTVELIDAAPARSDPWPDEYEVRIYALSPGTRELLRDIGAWERLAPARMQPVHRMDIFGDSGSALTFSPPAGRALAWILEANRLSAAIAEEAASRPGVTIRHGTKAVAFGAAADGAWAQLDDGTRLQGDLLVGADGPDSAVRAATSIAFEETAYDEAAIVANFETERIHEGIARQWFRPDGVLAWLPLPGQRISIVWSAPLAIANELQALDERGVERRVRDAGGALLGDLRLISGVGRFPLRSIRVPQPVAPGVALVGDAAHAVHPLAGQGVNLGFQDALVLAQTLAERGKLERAGDMRVLRRYARARREDVTAMQFVTDGLDRLFAAGAPGLRGIRNLGLRLVEGQEWAKGALAGRAMR
jgi:2-octaprenylphenol hydroxylase